MTISIVPSERTERGICIVCGKLTSHTHAYSNKELERTYVCNDCCQHGCGANHKVIEQPADEFFCKKCEVKIPADKAGKMMDKWICPNCQELLDPA